ncbi:hypothetical protein BaRGS_00032272 [Batillaria attramentaria]|uniref:Uncharacterized protein n=1 Tax=Batillaria attramentaria TaxID=370345 RepID=A0ABD0JNB0_9CAEN
MINTLTGAPAGLTIGAEARKAKNKLRRLMTFAVWGEVSKTLTAAGGLTQSRLHTATQRDPRNLSSDVE